MALEGSSYVIKFRGEPGGSKLFPYQLEVRPINMDMPPGVLWTDCDPPAAMLCSDPGRRPSAVLTITTGDPPGRLGAADFRDQLSRRDRARLPHACEILLPADIPPPTLAPHPYTVYSLLYPVTRPPDPVRRLAPPMRRPQRTWAGRLKRKPRRAR